MHTNLCLRGGISFGPIRAGALTLAAAAFIALACGPAAAASMVTDPTDDILCLLYYKTAKLDPPLDDFAAQAASVQKANEFDKQKAIDAEKARLQALLSSLQDVTTLRMGLDMQMGQYDSDLGEYDLTGLSPDQFVQFSCFQKQIVRLRFDNASDAQAWTLDAKGAEAALNKNGGDRNILVTLTVALSGVDATAPEDAPVLVGNVTDVVISGEFNHAKLGHYTVKAN